MTTQHTPGPWRIANSAHTLRVLDHHGGLIADVVNGNEADERLIAAAPDLLAACLAFIGTDDTEWNVDHLEYVAPMFRAAIEKAEGR